MNKLCTILLCLFAHLLLSQQRIKIPVILRTSGSAIMWDGYEAPIYGFSDMPFTDPVFPGKTLVVTEGDTVDLQAWNISQEHHTIHLHGLDLNTANDGDPMTSFELAHQQKYTYSFVAKNAGTYLYHCHSADVAHVQMGMYGLFIVQASGNKKTAWTNGPEFKKEHQFLFSELDSSWHNNPPQSDPVAMTVIVPKYKPSYFLINGKSRQQIKDSVTGFSGDPIYVRLANIGFMDNRVVFPAGLQAFVIDSDGRSLPHSIKTDTITLSPGERYGVMLYPHTEISGKIKVEYIDLNTAKTQDIQEIPFAISPPLAAEESISAENLSLFPNPSSTEVCIQIDRLLAGTLRCIVRDELGREMKVTDFFPMGYEPHHFWLSIADLPRGLYLLDLQIGSRKIIKKLLIAR